MTALVLLFVGLLALAAQIAWALARRQPEARRAMIAAVAVAAAGYLSTGHPLLADRPASPVPPDTLAVQSFADARQRWLTAAGEVGAWLTLAEALEEGGRTTDAVEALDEALKKNPNSPDLWIGLGNALVVHADGAVTHAARLAYAKGESLGARRPDLVRFRRMACARLGGC